MPFKLGDGIRIGTIDIFNSESELLVNAPTATALQTARTIALDSDLAGSASFDGTSDVVLSATIANNAVVLGTKTSGDYVESLIQGTGVILTNNTGEGSTPTIEIGQDVGTTSSVTFDTVTANSFSGPISGNANTADKWSTPRTVTFSTGDVTGSFTIDGSSDVSNIGLTIEPDSVALGTDTTGNYVDSLSEGTGVIISNGVGEGVTSTIAIGQSVGISDNVEFGSVTTTQISATRLVGDIVADNETSIVLENGTNGADAVFYGSVVGNADTADSWSSARLISLSNDLSGSVSIDGSTNVTLEASIVANSVELGVATTGNYVESVSDGVSGTETGTSGLTITGTGEGASVELAHANTSSITDINNTNGTVVQDLTFDVFGHVLTANSIDLDNRYYTETEADLTFVNRSGDSMSGFLTLHADPTTNLHAATKRYVDETAQGLRARPSADVSTTTNLSATYNNGTNGVGATLTSSSNGVLIVDGYTPSLGEEVLVKDQTNGFENGIYNVTQQGDASNSWILTREEFEDESDEIPGSFVFVINGNTLANTGWVATVDQPETFEIGTDDITFVQFSGAGAFTAGRGLTLDGNEFNVDTSLPFVTELGTITAGTWDSALGTITVGTWNADTIETEYGGTGQTTYTDGQLLIGNTATSSLSKSTLTAGTAITIDNTNGTITVNATTDLFDEISEAEVIDNTHSIERVITGRRIAYAFDNIKATTAATADQTGNSLTIDANGTGSASGSIFDGSSDITISYNTLGAVPSTRTLTFTTNNGITGGNGVAQTLSNNRSFTFGLTGQALALHDLSTDGFFVRTGVESVAARTIQSGDGVNVTNGDGVTDNPSIAVDGTVVRTSGAQSISGSKTFSSITNFSDTTETTGSSTGSVQISGGLAVAKSLYVGDEIFDGVSSTKSSTSTVSTTTTTSIDEFAADTYRSARYLIQITQGSNYQMSELRLLHDGTTTYITEYTVIETSGKLATITSDIDSGNVRILVDMTSATSAEIQLNRTLLVI
jgi:hypothetical protein